MNHAQESTAILPNAPRAVAAVYIQSEYIVISLGISVLDLQ
jgi:hypothetical protein